MSSPSVPTALSESDSVSDGLPVNSAVESFLYFVTSFGHFISEACLKLSNITQGYCISSRVLRIWFTGIEDMTHGTEDMTHGY